MAIYPKLTHAILNDPGRSAEMRFYRACEATLPLNYIAIHSLRWIATLNKAPRDGETDFVILDPDLGFITVEVKGGGVGYDAQTERWYTRNRNGVTSDLKRSPFAQAEDEKRAVRQKLEGHPQWSTFAQDRLIIGHAVFFPSMDASELSNVIGPDRPAEIIGCNPDLAQLHLWVKRVFRYWQGKRPPSIGIDARWVDMAKSVLLKSFEIRRLLGSRLAEAAEARARLTRDQVRALRLLGDQKWVAVCGGAGTGKTMLALHRAQALAIQGKRVLLLCHTRALSDLLKRQAPPNPSLHIATLCQFSAERADTVRKKKGIDLLAEAAEEHRGECYYNVQLPYALLRSLDEVPDDLYDAIVVDEGQDLSDDYWTPLPFLLRDGKDSYFYVFYDQNQRLFNRGANFPIKGEPAVLFANCRNTKPIHELAYKYHVGDETDQPDNEGIPIELIEGPDVVTQARLIHEKLCLLLGENRIDPKQITLLVAGAPPDMFFNLIQSQGTLPLSIRWSPRSHWQDNTILLDTVRRYKGLESDIVFLWGLDELDPGVDARVLYVGLSRAMSHLFLVGKRSTLRRIQQPRLGALPAAVPLASDWLPE